MILVEKAITGDFKEEKKSRMDEEERCNIFKEV